MQTHGPARESSEGRGYFAAWAGAFCGGLLAFAAGAAVGYQAGTAVVRNGTGRGEGMLSGLAEGLAPLASALGYGLVAGFAGSVLGCWIVLRVLGHARPARTAWLLAAMLPVTVVALGGLGSALGAEWLSAVVLAVPAAARATALRGDRGARPA